MKKENISNVRILVCDPSLREFGAVVVCGMNVIYGVCLKTEKTEKKHKIRVADDRVRRIEELASELTEIIEMYEIQYIISELPHGSQDAVAATSLGLVTGMLQGIASALDIGIEWYSERDSKICTCGKIAVEKPEMKERIAQIFEVNWTGIKYKDYAVADALSVYNTALKKSKFLKLLNKVK